MHEYYPGHLESAGQSCGASGPAVGVCASGSVCDQCALLSMWQGRASGSENPQGNAWEMHSQNLDKEIYSTHDKEGKKDSCLLNYIMQLICESFHHLPGKYLKTYVLNLIPLRWYVRWTLYL